MSVQRYYERDLFIRGWAKEAVGQFNAIAGLQNFSRIIINDHPLGVRAHIWACRVRRDVALTRNPARLRPVSFEPIALDRITAHRRYPSVDHVTLCRFPCPFGQLWPGVSRRSHFPLGAA